MKKILPVIAIILLLTPSFIFAEEPSETEVEETTGAVLTTFGLVFMTSLFGEIPEGVEFETEEESSEMTIIFEDFDVESYFDMLSEDEDSSLMADEIPSITFSIMNGTVSISEDGNMYLDVELEGGNIETIILETSEEELVELSVNGYDYSYMDEIFDDE